MTRTTLLATLAAAMTLTAGQALAEGPYSGTYGREQDNADIYVTQANEPADRGGSVASDTRTYGAPIETRSVLTGNDRSDASPAEQNSNVYLGTSWRYQDNADTNTRF